MKKEGGRLMEPPSRSCCLCGDSHSLPRWEVALNAVAEQPGVGDLVAD